jgi:hypothetical protein
MGLYILDFLLIFLLHNGLSSMPDSGDQGDFYDVGVGEFYNIDQYKEILRPLLRDLLHVMISYLVI